MTRRNAVNPTRRALPALLLLCFGAFSAPAHAQFGTAAVPRLLDAQGNPARNTFITIYPVAPFIVDFPGGSQTKYGGLFAIEHGFAQANRSTSESIGAW